MAVMGGVLFLPALLFSAASCVPRVVRRLARPPRGLKAARRDMLLIAFSFMFVFLAVQKTVRLEVERTWHWFFVPGWMLMGYFLPGAALAARRSVISLAPGRAWAYAFMGLLLAQLLMTLALAMCIQDYY
jgi:hypothetical protein